MHRIQGVDAKVSKPARGARSKTPLADYLAKPNPSFAWKVAGAIEGPGHTGAVLQLTSQTWLTADQVDRPLWTHWLTVIIPDEVVHDTAFLSITGGEHPAPPPAPHRPGRNARPPPPRRAAPRVRPTRRRDPLDRRRAQGRAKPAPGVR